MKKKIFLLLSIVLMASAIFAFKAYGSVEIPDPDIPVGDFDSINRCRCKNNGCYGGNALSLRAACAKSNEPLDCSKYNGNCPD